MAELISKQWGDRVDKVLDDFERNPRTGPAGSPPRPGWRPPLTGILLEDLPSEGQAGAAVMQKVANTKLQKVSIDGYPSVVGNSRPAFTLTYKGQTTTPLNYQATAGQIQAALAALSTIGTGNVTVALGSQAPTARYIFVNATGGTFTLSLGGQTTKPIAWNVTPAALQAALLAAFTSSIAACTVTAGNGNSYLLNVTAPAAASLVNLTANPTGLSGGAQSVSIGSLPGVWIVNFVGAFALPGAAPPALLTSAITTQAGGFWVVIETNTVWQDTGQVETINAFIPVGNPTPMRAGAACIGLWSPGVGYVLIACECREYPAVTGY